MNIAIAQSQSSQFSSGQILAYLKQQVHAQWSAILSTYTDEQLVAINNDLVIAIGKRASQKLDQTEGRLEGAILKELRTRIHDRIIFLETIQVLYADSIGWRKLHYIGIGRAKPSLEPRSPGVSAQ